LEWGREVETGRTVSRSQARYIARSFRFALKTAGELTFRLIFFCPCVGRDFDLKGLFYSERIPQLWEDDSV
jgi:hypothetical protein